MSAVSNETALKKLFAIGMLKKPLRKPSDSYDIGTSIFGGDTVSAMRAGASWPTDPEVLELREQLLAEFGPEHFLPTKAELAREVLAINEEKYDSGNLKNDARDRIAAYRLAAEILGHIEKPAIAPKRGSDVAPPAIEFAPYPK